MHAGCSSLPADDSSERGALIHGIYESIKSINRFEDRTAALVQAQCWSVLWTIDRRRLKKIAEDLRHPEAFLNVLLHLPENVCRAARLALIFIDQIPTQPSDSRQAISAFDQVRIRDGSACVVTKTPAASPCYIVPPNALSSNPMLPRALEKLYHVWDWKRMYRTRDKFQNTLIRPSNILCLSKELTSLWDQGLFALEPLDDNIDFVVYEMTEDGGETLPSTVYGARYRFHWLPRTSLSGPESKVNFAVHPDEILAKPPTNDTAPRRVLSQVFKKILSFTGSHQPADIKNGRIVDIFADNRALLPDRDLMRIRFDVLRVHALNGGRGPEVYSNLVDPDAKEADKLLS
ncbi:hypothetical protein CGMCC3_g4689 [Colletotrichum fructicola]|uniref:HNH nuclease domain-containing protein n=1 Tax=Colletotrichum fructicola (strain Nara gc5) TaxID=1213859 RepID=L2GCH5_COLFN|nr:uncharacterized protein CGMCC3_g4689 [Colletotrichum fructicola]KAF4489100.1 hypothetical protein CGGC5_v002852 [Colletotrichum fructicola Nara gc5]KAE9579082.1 hypothetical protein CGMCC3_g4689 [Colletotrichum fructicola]KAF4429837.1 hypothetical protein CFRS1_v011854 [Colletotrichum fructicola]KAF4902610.1 hypothetical protein CGCFRS4_v002176 [Colletotrichum fructicola]KAF5503114.1 hypothetical protein CGCF413_v005889 [Colletotrichum fructicola]